jgi:hypothetical protein
LNLAMKKLLVAVLLLLCCASGFCQIGKLDSLTKKITYSMTDAVCVPRKALYSNTLCYLYTNYSINKVILNDPQSGVIKALVYTEARFIDTIRKKGVIVKIKHTGLPVSYVIDFSFHDRTCDIQITDIQMYTITKMDLNEKNINRLMMEQFSHENYLTTDAKIKRDLHNIAAYYINKNDDYNTQKYAVEYW